MAEIKMSYIFIEKEKHESKILKEVLLEIIDEIVQVRDDEILKVNDCRGTPPTPFEYPVEIR